MTRNESLVRPISRLLEQAFVGRQDENVRMGRRTNSDAMACILKEFRLGKVWTRLSFDEMGWEEEMLEMRKWLGRIELNKGSMP